jgi:hypothetical protein
MGQEQTSPFGMDYFTDELLREIITKASEAGFQCEREHWLLEENAYFALSNLAAMLYNLRMLEDEAEKNENKSGHDWAADVLKEERPGERKP